MVLIKSMNYSGLCIAINVLILFRLRGNLADHPSLLYLSYFNLKLINTKRGLLSRRIPINSRSIYYHLFY